MVQDVVSMWAFRRRWSGRNLAVLLPGAVIGIALGYGLAAYVSDAAVAISVGVISIGFAIRRLVVERRPGTLAPTRADAGRGWFWGAVCGFTSMVAHAGGPPVPDLRDAAKASGGGLHRHRRDLLRARELAQGAAVFLARPVLGREPRDLRGAGTAGDHGHTGRGLAGAARLGRASLHGDLHPAGGGRRRLVWDGVAGLAEG
jgi:hypothetical protein